MGWIEMLAAMMICAALGAVFAVQVLYSFARYHEREATARIGPRLSAPLSEVAPQPAMTPSCYPTRLRS
jgi:membrane protein DedA with SNARE-associated domain